MSATLGDSIASVVDTIQTRDGVPSEDPSLSIPHLNDDPTAIQLVYSMLLWEASHELAGRAFAAIRDGLTGLNELRVCDVEEIFALLPREIPRREERAPRLFTALNAVFSDQHALSLRSVAAMPKREARQYLDGLAGVPPFVAARVVLVSMGGHAMPADDRIAAVLAHHGVIDDAKIPHGELIAHLERAVRAADAARVYALLELETLNVGLPKRTRTKSRSTRKPPVKRDASKKKAES